MEDPVPKPQISPADVLLQDPLSEVTRKERRMLLAVCAIGIAMVKTGLIPTRITNLGVEFSDAGRESLLSLLGLVTAYFIVAFLVYASSDFLAWRIRYRRATLEAEEHGYYLRRRRALMIYSNKSFFPLDRPFEARYFAAFYGLRRPVSAVRAAFDFALPILLGVYAMMLLFRAA